MIIWVCNFFITLISSYNKKIKSLLEYLKNSELYTNYVPKLNLGEKEQQLLNKMGSPFCLSCFDETFITSFHLFKNFQKIILQNSINNIKLQVFLLSWLCKVCKFFHFYLLKTGRKFYLCLQEKSSKYGKCETRRSKTRYMFNFFPV